MRRAELHMELSAGESNCNQRKLCATHFGKVALLNITCLTLESMKVQVC